MPSEAQNASSLIGRTIGGRYTIKAAIGSGGMGHVYRATQAPINREVAIKVLRVDLAHQEGVAERFKREARAASLIQHPNAITIFDFGEDGEILYLAMEFLAGETLRQRVRREPPLEVDEALDLFEAMAGALGAAHKVGVVHRDLKPDNIFLAKFDSVGLTVKVLDFGLAKLLDRAADNDGLVTEANLRLGTPRFMAPEQALGIQPIDSRCDVYALALLLFEMLAQRAPFMGEDGMEVLAQRLRREAPRLSTVAPTKNFSEQMDDLLASMLKRDRDQRPLDANVILARLREIRKAGQVYAPAPAGDAGATVVNAVSPYASRSTDAARPVRPGMQGAQAARGSRPGVGRSDGLVALDQDDLPEKPTVVVDSGMADMAGHSMQAAAVRNSHPGMHSPSPLTSSSPPNSGYAMAASQQFAQPHGYGAQPSPSPAGYGSQPSTPPVASATDASRVSPARRRKLLWVLLVVLVAILAPVLALVVRSLKTPPVVETPDVPLVPDEPPTKDPPPDKPEPGANNTDSKPGESAVDSSGKGKTKQDSKGKGDGKGKGKPKTEAKPKADPKPKTDPKPAKKPVGAF